MVISQAQGRYSTPQLLTGKYTVQGFGGGYQSDPAGPVEVGRGQQAKMDVVLSSPQKVLPAQQQTRPDAMALMPEGDAKKILATRCNICHGMERLYPKREIREDWQRMLNRMQSYLYERRIALSDT